MILRMIAMVVITMTMAAVGFSTDNEKMEELKVVPSVDLSRYAGRWYEIARLPNKFQKKCASGVAATYELRSDGKVKVINECRKASGEITRATGKAKVADKKTNAKLKVTFFWPFYGDYWIFDLGSNYEYALVGEPKRRYFWILSRTREMNTALYDQLLEKARQQGFDVSRVVRTQQP